MYLCDASILCTICLNIHNLHLLHLQVITLQNVIKAHSYVYPEGVQTFALSCNSFVRASRQIFYFPPSVLTRPPSRSSLSPAPAAYWSHGSVPGLAAGTTSGTETMTPLALMACLARCPSVPSQGGGRNGTKRGDKERRRPSRCILLFIPFTEQNKKSERTGYYTVI